MSGSTFDRAFRVFEEVCDLAGDARSARLAELCGDDAALRREVEELLAADRTSSDFDVPPPGADGILGASLPDRVGDYEVTGLIGEGGMGVVYEAVQSTPRRRVALKLLRPGLVTAERLRRFDHEAQVLGWLNHPGIAQIYESGIAETDAGRQPFLAMELVEGERLDHWVERRRPSREQRLELVARICDAVQHAHQKGVIHRDLKPANVLVDADGRPKILDFGVARITNADLAMTTAEKTVAGEILGTLSYMSPEQVRADPSEVDTRSDVYALGVLAYEVVSGQRPYHVETFALHEAARVIVEDEPTTLGAVDPGLRGDVEVLVAKAMAKEKERRYGSAEELASDIRRHLANEPILAQRASRLYRFRKFARRNRAVVAGLAAVFSVLVAGVAVSTTLFLRVREEARENERLSLRYQREADAANEMVTFLEEIFTSVRPGDVPTARDLVDESVLRIRERLDLDAATRGRLLSVLARTYMRLGHYPEARPLLEGALPLVEGAHGERSLEHAQVLERLAQCIRMQGDLDRAIGLAENVLAVREELLGPEAFEVGEACNNLASLKEQVGSLEEAETLYERALAIHMAQGKWEEAVVTRLNWARNTHGTGRSGEAVAMIDEVLAGELDEVQRVLALDARASLLKELQRPAEAERDARTALELALELYDPRSTVVAGIRQRLGIALVELGRFAEAEELLRVNLEVNVERYGEHSAEVAAAKHELGYLYHDLGRYEEAEDYYLQAYDTVMRQRGGDESYAFQVQHNLAILYQDAGRMEEAEALGRTAYERRRDLLGPTAAETLYSLRSLGTILRRAGKLELAGELRYEHLELVESSFGKSSELTQQSRHDLGVWLTQVGRGAEAIDVLLEAWDRMDGRSDETSLAEILADSLAEAFGSVGDEAEARLWRERALEARGRFDED